MLSRIRLANALRSLDRMEVAGDFAGFVATPGGCG